MNILFIITRSDFGGAQSVVINLANSLSMNNEVIVVAGAGDGKIWQMLSPNIIKEYVPSLQRKFSLIKEILTIRSFKNICHKYKPDIIHLHSSKAGVLGRLAFPKNKIVYTVHGFDSIRIAYRKYLPLEKILQKKCSTIVGVSKYDKINLLNEGITANVELIYNGTMMPIKLKENPFLHLKAFKGKILCIARLSPPKNIDIFLGVASKLLDYAFIWIGNQNEFCGQHSNNVFFMGSLPNAGSYNEYVDLFILPSDYEGLPITIIEAMAFGKPVVASRVGGISEIVVDNVNGYTVDNSVEAFYKKICYVLENNDVYSSFSENALKFYQEKLTIDKMVDGYLKIYNKIINKNK